MTLHSCKFLMSDIFSNILIEQRHANQLSKKNLDDESRLEVIYRVLKD